MSNPSFTGDLPKAMQWKTDNKPCAPCMVQPCSSLLVEVTGDLNGKEVTFEGGLTLSDQMPFLAHTRVTPYLQTVPAVSYIRPITEAVGITITVRGIK